MILYLFLYHGASSRMAALIASSSFAKVATIAQVFFTTKTYPVEDFAFSRAKIVSGRWFFLGMNLFSDLCHYRPHID